MGSAGKAQKILGLDGVVADYRIPGRLEDVRFL